MNMDSASRLFQVVVDNVDAVVYTLRVSARDVGGGQITFVNDRLRPLLGYDPHACIGQSIPWFQSMHEDDVAPVKVATARIYQSRQPGIRRYRVRHCLSGEYRWFEDHLVPVGVDGETLEFVGLMRDVSRQILLENELRRAEVRHNQLLEASPYAILSVDREGRIASANDKVRIYFGYYREELIGQSVELLVPDAARDRHVHDRKSFGHAAHARAMSRGRSVSARRKDGTEFQADISLTPVEDAAGRPVVRCVIRDATEHGDEVLRRSEERYRTLFEDGLTGNFVSTVDGRILACNSTMATLLGFPSVEEVKVGNWMTACTDAKEIDSLLARLRTDKRAERCALTLRRQDGRLVRLIANAVGVFRNGEDLFEIHGQLFDDTERYEIEEQLRQAQKMGAIGLLAGGIAHDFNNQLTAILGFTELLTNQIEPDGSMGGDLQRIAQAATHAAALTRQLLAFSRRQVLTLTVVDVNQIVQDLRGVLSRLLGEPIEVTTLLSDGLYPVMADALQLGQIVMNLALNARDAMARGGRLSIETSNVDLDADYVRAHPETARGEYVCLRVRDTGTGMAPEVQTRVFEPFFTTKERGKGTGLGLAVVHGIVNQLKGHIRFDSVPNLGTTFEVYLPKTTQSAPATGGPATMGHVARVPGSATILLVEDEDSVRLFTTTVLGRSGYHVLEANAAEAALSVLERHKGPIHLLLTDVILPAMDGQALCEHVHLRHPDLPVLFMSGYVTDSENVQRILGTSVRLLEKPFTGNELLRRIQDLLCDTAANVRPTPSLDAAR